MDCHIFTKPVFTDSRGYFVEQFNCEKDTFGFQIKQISESVSLPHVFRGFHFQIKNKMNKIMRVVTGKVQVYTLDLLLSTPILKSFELSSINYTKNLVQYLYVPSHYAVGFITLEDTRMQYFHDEVRSEHSRSINIESVKEQVPLINYIHILSDADKNAMSWTEWKSLNEEQWLL